MPLAKQSGVGGSMPAVSAMLMFFLLISGLAACTQRSDVEEVSGTVRVRLPIVEAEGVRALDVVELHGIEKLSEVRGHYAKFAFGPKVTPAGLQGEMPRARFLRTSDGIFVPSDELSQHMASIYWQMQKLSELDTEVGASSLSLPRQIGVSVRIRQRGEFVSDNAFYDGDSDAILMVPYKAGALPLALNPGVIAHEHFHAIFNRAVVKPLIADGLLEREMRRTAHDASVLSFFDLERPRLNRTRPSQPGKATKALYDSVLLKAVNEGLADVWGWVHTGDTEFLSRSLKQFKAMRSLQLSSQQGKRIVDRAMFEADVERVLTGSGNSETAVTSFAYLPGTWLARALIAVMVPDGQPSSLSERKKIARRVIRALPLIGQSFRAEMGPGPSDVLAALVAAEPLSDEQKAAWAAWNESAR